MLFAVIIILLVGAFFMKRYLSKPSRLSEYSNKIPGPKPLPIVGNALEFGLSGKAIFQQQLWLTKHYGPVYRVWIGTKLLIVLADPDSIELVIGNNRSLNKSSFYDFANSFLGLGLLLNKGETWKRHRKIIAPTLQGLNLARFVHIFNANIDILIDKLSEHANGLEFDISPMLYLCALDIISESAMGVKVNAQLQSDSDYVKAVHGLEEGLFIRGFRPWLHPDIIFRLTSLGRKYAEYLSVIQDKTELIIEERKKQRSEETYVDTLDSGNDAQDREIGLKKRKDFLGNMLDHVGNGAYLTNEELLHEVHTMMLTGHDTTANSLNYTCWLNISIFRGEVPSLGNHNIRGSSGIPKSRITSGLTSEARPSGAVCVGLVTEYTQMVMPGLDHVAVSMLFGTTFAACLSFGCLSFGYLHGKEKALQEIITIFGDPLRNATMEDLNEIQYLEQIIKESLRLFPAASFIARQLSEDINTGKYIFPAGCEVAVSIFMVHRHPNYFPEPEKFDPDRFLPENCVDRHPYCYIPFGAEQRNCVGYKYAMLEMKATLSKLLRHFKILPPENPFLDLELSLQVATKSINGIRVRLEPRKFIEQL